MIKIAPAGTKLRCINPAKFKSLKKDNSYTVLLEEDEFVTIDVDDIPRRYNKKYFGSNLLTREELSPIILVVDGFDLGLYPGGDPTNEEDASLYSIATLEIPNTAFIIMSQMDAIFQWIYSTYFSVYDGRANINDLRSISIETFNNVLSQLTTSNNLQIIEDNSLETSNIDVYNALNNLATPLTGFRNKIMWFLTI